MPLPGHSNYVKPLDAPLSTTDSLPLPGSSGNGSTLNDPADASSAEGEALDEVKPKPRANPAKRAAKAKGSKAAAKEQPADESLLDDLLKE